MVRLATLTHALHAELVASGVEPDEATAHTAKVTWSVYGRAGRAVGVAARLVAPTGSVEALRTATRTFRRFPFGPPDYVMVDRDDGPQGVVAFDVQRCPVARYFRAADSVELCRASFCDLDFQLAPLWGARLERSQTLVEGHTCCDFRWVSVGATVNRNIANFDSQACESTSGATGQPAR